MFIHLSDVTEKCLKFIDLHPCSNYNPKADLKHRKQSTCTSIRAVGVRQGALEVQEPHVKLAEPEMCISIIQNESNMWLQVYPEQFCILIFWRQGSLKMYLDL